MQSWVETELAELNLGDKRRNERIMHMVERIAEKPKGSIPRIFNTHAEMTAAYRALRSEAIEPEAICEAAIQACLERVKGEKMVLAIQDTTTFNFTSHPATEGTGPLSDPYIRGFLLHDVLAVSTDGVPLGLLHQKLWTRDEESTRDQRKQRPFEDKESFRWVESLRAIHEVIPADTTVLTVADREADIYEMFAEPRPENSELLIRGCYNRRLCDEEQHLWDALDAQPVSGILTVALRRHPKRKARQARLAVRFRSVTLNPPHYRVENTQFEPVTLTAILVTEPKPPWGERPVRWLLLTTLPVDSLESACECIEYYGLRWLIERYHYTLKSGCKIEDSQLRTVKRLERLLCLYFVVAWRLLWITYASRVGGGQPCTVAFTELEWRTAYRAQHPNKPPPRKPPSLEQMVRWVAQLGGFIGRKGDGEPGVKVLWRGLTRLQDIVLGAMLATQQDVYNA
jgi:hypothetical protein